MRQDNITLGWHLGVSALVLSLVILLAHGLGIAGNLYYRRRLVEINREVALRTRRG